MLVTSFLVAALVPAQDQPIIVEAPAKEAKVCRTERSTGSRVVKQVCKSAAEQKKDDQDARNQARHGQPLEPAPGSVHASHRQLIAGLATILQERH